MSEVEMIKIPRDELYLLWANALDNMTASGPDQLTWHAAVDLFPTIKRVFVDQPDALRALAGAGEER